MTTESMIAWGCLVFLFIVAPALVVWIAWIEQALHDRGADARRTERNERLAKARERSERAKQLVRLEGGPDAR